MPAFLASFLLKIPFLKKIWAFVSSPKFLAFIGAIIIVLFVSSQVTSCSKKYIDQQVKQQTTVATQKLEIDQLKHQIKVVEKNQEIVDKVLDEKRLTNQLQQKKTKQIEEHINEEVQKGHDGYTDSLLTDTIDRL